MRYTYRHIGILTISLIVASCSFSQKQADNNHDKDMNPNVKIVVLDPGHFHASLLQKNPLASVNDTIRVYAPEGAEVKQYLNDINSYNQRAENPTSWKEEIYIVYRKISECARTIFGSVGYTYESVGLRESPSYTLLSS